MPLCRTVVPTLVVGVVALLLGACSPADGGPDDDGATSIGPPSAASTAPATPDATTSPDGAPGSVTLEAGGRPFELVVPAGHDGSEPAPLVVVLHGYGDDPAGVDARFGLRDDAARRGVLYALPEGTQDSTGRRFWDATDACCAWAGAGPGVDDSAYLAAVVRTVAETHAVDPDRVALVGHSNGGFMAYRAACDHADLVRLVVSVAGAMAADDAACAPERPVSVVQAHGTADPVVSFDGGNLADVGLPEGAAYPSAADSVAAWARLDRCDDEPVAAGTLDLDVGLPGAETSVAAYSGCAGDVRVELWTIDGGIHSPALGDGFSTAVLDAVTGEVGGEDTGGATSDGADDGGSAPR